MSVDHRRRSRILGAIAAAGFRPALRLIDRILGWCLQARPRAVTRWWRTAWRSHWTSRSPRSSVVWFLEKLRSDNLGPAAAGAGLLVCRSGSKLRTLDGQGSATHRHFQSQPLDDSSDWSRSLRSPVPKLGKSRAPARDKSVEASKRKAFRSDAESGGNSERPIAFDGSVCFITSVMRGEGN